MTDENTEKQPKGPYEMFETDPDLEKKGIVIDYGDYYWIIARAGGANKHWEREIERVTRPIRRAIQTETLDNEVGKEKLREAFVNACVVGWGSKKHGEGKMLGKGGIALEFNKENVTRVLTELDWQFQDLRQSANNAALYRKVLEDHDAKNS